MKLSIKKATTSFICHIFVQDSSSTTGAGKTALVNTNVALSYMRAGASAAVTGITVNTIGTLGTFAGSDTAAAFKLVDDTNLPGVYELHLPNNALATGANQVVLLLKDAGSNNVAMLPIEIQLVAYDPTDAVRLGLTALPNTACTTNASLLTSGTGTDQLSVSGGRGKSDVSYWNASAIAAPDTAGYPKITVKSGTGTGELNLSGGRTDANVTYWKGATAGDPATVADIWANATRTLTAANNITSNDGEIELGTDNRVKVTANAHTCGATVAAVTGAVGSVTGDVGGNLTGSVGSVATGGITSGSFGTGAITSTAMATDAVSSASVSSAAVTKIAGGILTNSTYKIVTDSSGRVTPRLERITKNAALDNFEFLMVLSSDHATPATGKTITATRSIDGANYSACANSASEVQTTGTYKINLDSSDLNGNVITLCFAATACDTRYITIITQEQ